MPVSSTHTDYDATASAWSRARDVLAGEDAVKAGRERYLPRLDSQTDDEYLAYQARASFFNATARTAEGYTGLRFRRPPFVKIPEGSGIGVALSEFVNDVDMLGTSLFGYAKNVVNEVIGVGKGCVTLDDFTQTGAVFIIGQNPGTNHPRMLDSLEQIINWRVERVNGRNIPTLIVLQECGKPKSGAGDDEFARPEVEQIRVLKLVPEDGQRVDGGTLLRCVVELWQPKEQKRKSNRAEWELMESRVPLRLGKPLPLIPFVFHGPRHSRADVDSRAKASVNL